MKSITTLTLLAGVTFGFSAYAELEWNKAEPIKVADESSQGEEGRHTTSDSLSKEEGVDPTFEAFKMHVNAALDARKDKAPKEMKGQQEEMKAYVGRALDAQRLADKKFAASLDGSTLKENVENLIIGAGAIEYLTLEKLKAPLENFQCFKDFPDSSDDVSSLQSCITSFFADQSPNGYSWAQQDYGRLLNNDCTGNHWWNGNNGTCSNDNWRHACVIVGNAIQAPGWVINCKAAGPQ